MEKQSRQRKKIKLGSYPNTSVIFSITLALLVMGAFGLLLVHAKKLEEVIRQQVEVQVFLKKDIPENQSNQIGQMISAKPYLAFRDDRPVLKFISKEEAAETFIQETGEDFYQFLGENPLRDAYSLQLKPEYLNTESIKQVRLDLQKLPGVFEVAYTENLIENVESNIQKAGLVLLGIFVLMIISTVLLINNSIKLALFSQRFLIRSMQLVGATAWFIQRPFLLRASMQGLLGALLACLSLAALLNLAYTEIHDLRLLFDPIMLAWVFGTLFILGLFLGIFSSYRSVKKYLKLSLDELY